MLAIAGVKWALVLLLFVVLPIALMRYMVHKTIELPVRKPQHRRSR